jgi:short-subunit dehydrogenase
VHRSRRFVVTGASSGIGRAIVRELSRRRGRVALIARGTDGLQQAADEMRAAGSEAMILPLDVADAGAVLRAADTVAGEWGGIDVWVNDAMLSVFSPFEQMTPQEYRRVTEVTYLGTVHGTLAALRHMRPADAGVIIQIGSALAYRSIPLQSAYCGAKAAVRGFTDSLRCELIHDRSQVSVTMLQLPAVNTPQFDVVRSRLPRHPRPVPPIYQPEIVARAVGYAADHPSREMWIGFSARKAIVGNWLFPGLLDHYLARTCYEAQQTPWPISPDRPDNLDSPLPGDRGAHGNFDPQSRAHSPGLWLRTHRVGLAAAGAALAAAGVVVARRKDDHR